MNWVITQNRASYRPMTRATFSKHFELLSGQPDAVALLDCAGRAQRRRRFRIAEDARLGQRTPKRCRAALATALQDAACLISAFRISAFQLSPL